MRAEFPRCKVTDRSDKSLLHLSLLFEEVFDLQRVIFIPFTCAYLIFQSIGAAPSPNLQIDSVRFSPNLPSSLSSFFLR